MSLINKLSGTGVALITPFKKNNEVDFDALAKVIDFVIDNGVEYLVTLGYYRRNANTFKTGTDRNCKIYSRKNKQSCAFGFGNWRK